MSDMARCRLRALTCVPDDAAQSSGKRLIDSEVEPAEEQKHVAVVTHMYLNKYAYAILTDIHI